MADTAPAEARELDLPDAEVKQLRAEVAQLRAGESEQPAPEGQEVTPAEWIHRFNRITGEQRITHIEAMQSLTKQATACWLLDHDSLKEQLDQASAHIRDLYNGDAYKRQANELSLTMQKLERVRTCAERWRLQRPVKSEATTTPEQLVGELAADCGDAILAILGERQDGGDR